MSGIARLVTSCDTKRLDPDFAARFVEIERDAELLEGVARLTSERHGALKTTLHRALRFYMSDFDANALLGMYPMMLLCTSHWQTILAGGACGSLLDIGAGSGDVTAALAPLFDEIHTIEVSRGMARRLRKRGFFVHAIDIADVGPPARNFDVVTCLNVLDRCAKPRSLLRSATEALGPGGRLVIALALPFRPFYYDGASTPEPSEQLTCQGGSFEDQVLALVEHELSPLGLFVERWARAPYLSAGDKDRALYELDDVVLVLQRR